MNSTDHGRSFFGSKRGTVTTDDRLSAQAISMHHNSLWSVVLLSQTMKRISLAMLTKLNPKSSTQQQQGRSSIHPCGFSSIVLQSSTNQPTNKLTNYFTMAKTKTRIGLLLTFSLCLLAICFQSILVALFTVITDKNEHDALQSIFLNKKKEALCILSTCKHFSHFPHTAEQIYPCWSFFQKYPDLQCAFQLPKNQSFAEGWVQDVVHAMKCNSYPYRGKYQYKDFRNVDFAFQTRARIQEIWKYRQSFPRLSWFNKTSDGHQLALAITKHFGRKLPQVTTYHNTNPRPISIGIIQRDQRRAARGANRVILNLDDILDDLRKAFPPDQVVIYQADPMELDTAQQVEFFYKHDIVMAIMGAACTNVAFMRPGSVFFEIFTPKFYDPMYMHIAQSVGVQYLNYTATWPEVFQPNRTKEQKKIRNNPSLDVDFTLHATVIVDRLQRAVEMFQQPQRNTQQQPLALDG